MIRIFRLHIKKTGLHFFSLIGAMGLCACIAGAGGACQPANPSAEKPRSVPHHEKAPAGASQSLSNSPEYVAGQVLVKFKPHTDVESISAIQRTLALKTIRVVSKPDLYLMEITDGSTVEGVINRLKQFDEVLYAEPNAVMSTDP
jgi:hypothetical protein